MFTDTNQARSGKAATVHTLRIAKLKKKFKAEQKRLAYSGECTELNILETEIDRLCLGLGNHPAANRHWEEKQASIARAMGETLDYRGFRPEDIERGMELWLRLAQNRELLTGPTACGNAIKLVADFLK
jgi:hypothetical protein